MIITNVIMVLPNIIMIFIITMCLLFNDYNPLQPTYTVKTTLLLIILNHFYEVDNYSLLAGGRNKLLVAGLT